LSARVLDVALADGRGIDWALVARNAGVVLGPGAGIHVTDFDGLVRAIGAFGAVRTIASPQLLAMNNQPATMRIGEAMPLLDAASADGGRLPVPATFALSITPQIGADGIVHMTVSPAYADEPRGSPVRQVTEADSVMRVRGGDTVIIAGLSRDSNAFVATGAAPAAGSEAGMRRELVVLLTPTVVTAGGAPASGVQ
jgi:general secretion pathway protein D